MVDRYHYTQPKIEVVSIGAGGGSIVSFDAARSRFALGRVRLARVPALPAYGLGGTEPTVTDVLMLIGYMDPRVPSRREHEASTRMPPSWSLTV